MRDAASMRCLTRVPLFLRPHNRPSHRDTLVFKQAFAHFNQGGVVMIQPPLCQGKGVSTSDLQVAAWDSLGKSAWVPCCGSLLRPAAAQDLQSYCHITVPRCEFRRRRLVSRQCRAARVRRAMIAVLKSVDTQEDPLITRAIVFIMFMPEVVYLQITSPGEAGHNGSPAGL